MTTDLGLGKREEVSFHHITVHIRTISNLRSIFPHSEVKLRVCFLEDCIFESALLHQNEVVEVDEELHLDLDAGDKSRIETLINNPMVFTFVENEIPPPPVDVLQHSHYNPAAQGRSSWMSTESFLEVEDPLRSSWLDSKMTSAGRKSSPGPRSSDVSIKSRMSVKSKMSIKSRISMKSTKSRMSVKSKRSMKSVKSKRSNKSVKSKGSKASKGDTRSEKSKVSKASRKDPVFVEAFPNTMITGQATLDLIQLFLGEVSFDEDLVIISELAARNPLKSFMDLPKISVHVVVDRELPPGTIYDFTVESIYNLPNILQPTLNYEISFMLPEPNSSHNLLRRFSFENNRRSRYLYKQFYNTNLDSNQIITHSLSSVMHPFHNKSLLALKDWPRIEYNAMKRFYLDAVELEALKLHIRKYRCILLEIFVSRTKEISFDSDPMKKRFGGRMSGSSPRTSREDSSHVANFLHLMAYVDLSRLLYPGEHNVRVACPLQTFNMEEAMARAGMKTSVFHSIAVAVPQQQTSSTSPRISEITVKSRIKTKTSSSYDITTSKGRGSGFKKLGKQASLKSQITPPAQALPKTSMPIYNEAGEQTFVIIECSTRTPIEAAYNMTRLSTLMKDALNEVASPTEIKNLAMRRACLHTGPLEETVRRILDDIGPLYSDFCVEYPDTKTQEELFIEFLQANQVYQPMVTALMRSIIHYVNTSGETISSGEQNHALISSVYREVMEEVYKSVSKYMIAGIDTHEARSCSDLIHFAYEALELEALGLAQRYFEQALYDNHTALNWLHFVVYHVFIGGDDKAMECCREALLIDANSLIANAMFAMLLARRKEYEPAEAFALRVTLIHPHAVEGYCALYYIYFCQKNIEAMGITKSKADFFVDYDTDQVQLHDLVWDDKLLPVTFFFKMARMFIALKFLNEAEVMLITNFDASTDGFADYLLAVIGYYKQNYEVALINIDNALNLGGCDYIKCAMKGHILAKYGETSVAIKEFRKVFELNTPPADDRFVYFLLVRSGLCYSRLHMNEQSRNAFFKVCGAGSNASAYCWLCAGVLLYHQEDHLGAERFLTQANLLDNRMPETWAYLALVNLQLEREQEAQICYNQVYVNSLQNIELLQILQRYFMNR